MRGVIFEESTMPAAAQLAFADRLEADRAREDARKIRLQQGRAAGPYAVTGGSVPRERERRGGVRRTPPQDERA